MATVVENAAAAAADKGALNGSSQEYWNRIMTLVMRGEEIPIGNGEVLDDW